jgi:hypothetical protein
MDIVTALLAVWLFISPWVLDYGTGDSWNTWIVSALIFLIAVSALNQPSSTRETANMVLAAWMFISPWVLSFSHPSFGASLNQWLVGAAVFLISGASLYARRHLEAGGGLPHAHAR